jgi:hypothetical protein
MAYRNQFIDIPLGLGGLDDNSNFYQIPPSRLVTASNIVYRDDSIVKAPGFAAFDSTGVGSVDLYGGHDWRPTTVLQYQVTAWSDGSVYRSGTADTDATTLKSGLTFTSPVHFVTGGFQSLGTDRTLYMYSEGVRPQQVSGNGTSMANLTNDSVDWGPEYPSAAVYHDARVYAFNLSTAPHNLYISALRDHGDFDLENGSVVFSVYPGEGEYISAAMSYPTPQDNSTLLYVFKYPYGVYKVDTTNITGYSLPSQRVRDDVGCAGSKAITKVGNDIFFVSSNGRLYSMRALETSVNTSDADITSQFNLDGYIDENLDFDRLKWIKLQYNEKTKELYYFFTSMESAGEQNDKGLVFNLSNPNATKISVYEQGEYFNDCWEYKTDTGDFSVYIGGEEGKFYSIDSENRSVDGSEIAAEVALPPTDFRWINPKLQGTRKRFDMIELSVIPTGDYDLDVTFVADGKDELTRVVNLSSGSATYGSATYGTSTYGGSTVLKKRIPVNVWAETLQIKFSNSGLNENFKLINLRIYFKQAGELYESA